MMTRQVVWPTARSALRLLLSVCLAALALLVPILLVVLLAVGFLTDEWSDWLVHAADSLSDSLSPWESKLALFALAALPSFYLAAVFMRILARFCPLQADSRRHKWTIIVLGLALVTVVSALLWNVRRTNPEVDALEKTCAQPPGDPSDSTAFAAQTGCMAGAAAVAIFPDVLLVAGVCSLVIPLGWQIYRHFRPPRPTGLLFLRCFRGLGDATIVPGLLRATPKGVPVAFIASPATKTSSWDPVILAFAGIRWHKPWANVPLFLRSTDDTWQHSVADWISGADAVILDLSDKSASLDVEINLIDSHNAAHKTVWLMREPQSQLPQVDSSRVLPYKLAWLPAIPRMAIGLVAAAYAPHRFFGTFGSLAAAVLVAPLILRPQLDRRSIQSLRRTLSALLQDSRTVTRRNAVSSL